MAWHPGDLLTVRGADWRVVHSTAYSDCLALDLSNERSAETRTILVPFDRPRAPAPPCRRVVSRRRWAHETSAALRSTFPYGGLRFCPSTIRLLPFQLEPALAMLRHGIVRVLVADEVGLGKTVEAGLVIREIAMRDLLSRTLVICPAALRAQWAGELATLFGVATFDADAAWMRTVARRLPPDVNPWSLPGVYLSSMDLVKRPEALRPLEDVRWDLLVVDEAHAATPASHRRAAIHALARRAVRVMLLTATPHSGDDEQFRSMCAIGRGPSSPPIALFNRSRAGAAGIAPVRSAVLSVRPTTAEHRAHRLLETYLARVWAASRRRGDPAAALVATVLGKRALSSTVSLALSIRRRLVLLGAEPVLPVQLALALDEDEDPDAAPDALLAAAGLDVLDEERHVLAALAAAAEEAAAGAESKMRTLLRLLRRARQPAIVFSEYRDTAERIERQLAGAGHETCLLHGGMPLHARRQALATFASGRHHLVATDAAAEGLNLHHACRLLIHYELPWSSARLEQRCGRLNRIGQARRVHEIALVADDTAEQRVLVPLLARAARARAFVRTPLARQLTESRVAAHLLGGAPLHEPVPRPVPKDVAPLDLREEGEAEAARLETLRRLDTTRREAARGRPRRGAIVPIARVRPKEAAPSSRLDVVAALTLVARQEGIVDRGLVTLAVELPGRRWHRQARSLKTQVDAALAAMRPALEPALRRQIDARRRAVEPLRAVARAALRAREADLRVVLESTARELVQAGLFDRRALRAHAVRARAREALEEDARRRPAAGATEDGLAASYEIVAICLRGPA